MAYEHKESQRSYEEEIQANKALINEAMRNISNKLNESYNQFQKRFERIKDVLGKRKELRQKRLQKVRSTSITPDNSMSDLINDLKIN